MLDVMRKYSQSTLIYVMFGIIIIVFIISFGPASRGLAGGGTRAYAVEVNGEVISLGEFQSAYNNRVEAIQQQNPSFSNEAAERVGLRQMVVEELVRDALLAKEARRHGIVVTDRELAEELEMRPYFQTQGHFDRAKYDRLVTGYFRTSTKKFEDRERRHLFARKMEQLLRDSVQVADSELKMRFVQQGDRRDFSYIAWDPKDQKVDVPDAKAQEAKLLKDEMGVVKEYYTTHTADFHHAKEVRARHILVKVAKKAPPSVVADAKKKAEAALERIKKGEPFADVAKAVSEDEGSKAEGGDLGFFGPGRMVKPFEDAAFKLAEGKVSDPVRSDFGWHVIEVTGVKPPIDRSLEDAKMEIAARVVKQRAAKNAAKSLAEAALAQAKAGTPLSDIAPPVPKPESGKPLPLMVEGLHSADTGLVPKSGDRIPGIGVEPKMAKIAFQMKKPGEVAPEVFEVEGRFVVLALKDHHTADMKEFDKQRDALLGTVRQQKERSLAEAWYQGIRKDASVAINPVLQKRARAARGTLPGQMQDDY